MYSDLISCLRLIPITITFLSSEPCPIEGQVYMECGSACPPTCANPNPACIALCVQGCQCPTGTVLDEDANKCIDPDDCDTGKILDLCSIA